MKYFFAVGACLLSVVIGVPGAWAGPYLQLEVGVLSRDVVEEDPSLVGFKFRGDAVSTRLMVKAGVELFEFVNLYVQGGGADLSIEEFSDYDADLSGAYGGGVRLNLYRSPHRDRFTLFVEGEVLRYTTDDHVEIEQDCTGLSGCPDPPENFFPRLADEKIQWNEYTVKLGASGRFEGIEPYGGIRLSRVDGKDRIRAKPDENFSEAFHAQPDLEEDDNFGIFGGVDIFLDRTEKTALNFEVSLFDQDSFRAAIRREF